MLKYGYKTLHVYVKMEKAKAPAERPYDAVFRRLVVCRTVKSSTCRQAGVEVDERLSADKQAAYYGRNILLMAISGRSADGHTSKVFTTCHVAAEVTSSFDPKASLSTLA